MKITRRKIELRVEKSEKFLDRRLTTVFAFCSICERQIRMISPEDAANVARTTTRTIYRLIEANRIHFTETDNGQVFVCLDSLLNMEVSSNEETNFNGHHNYLLR